MREAVAEAKTVLMSADAVAETMAYMLKGRLRRVDNPYTLTALKRELKNFNCHAKKWEEEK